MTPRTGLIMGMTVLALGAAPATSALAWGDEGHEVIALIARSYLAPITLERVDEILSEDREGSGASGMAAAATRADRWRVQDRSTAGWHYTDLELSDPDMARACDTARSCAVDKVGQFAQTLADGAAAPAERLFALKMVLHLVGDLHQALHAASTPAETAKPSRLPAPPAHLGFCRSTPIGTMSPSRAWAPTRSISPAGFAPGFPGPGSRPGRRADRPTGRGDPTRSPSGWPIAMARPRDAGGRLPPCRPPTKPPPRRRRPSSCSGRVCGSPSSSTKICGDKGGDVRFINTSKKTRPPYETE